MDELAVQHYLDQVPVEIREAVMELDTQQKWAIYIALSVDGDKYFNQLKKQFKANPNTIDKALKSLIEGGLVAKKVKQLVDTGDTNKTYYTTTRLGEKLLTNLYEVVLQPLAMGEMQSTQIRINKYPATNVELIQSGKHYLPYELPETYKPLTLQLEGVRT